MDDHYSSNMMIGWKHKLFFMGEHYFWLRRVRSNSWRHFRKQRSNYWKSIFFLYAYSSNSFCRSIIIHCIYRSVYDVFFRVYMRVCVEFLKRKEKIEARTHTFERKPPHKRYSIFFIFYKKRSCTIWIHRHRRQKK